MANENTIVFKGEMPGQEFRLPPSPALTAEGVYLQRFSRRHLGLLVKASHDPEVVRWTFIPPDLDRAAAGRLADRWLDSATRNVIRQYVISIRDGEPALGMISLMLQDPDDGFRADVAYWLLPQGRGRGLVTRALKSVLRWAVEEAGVPRFALYTKLGNIASNRVAERCGFRLAGRVELERQGTTLTLRRWTLSKDAISWPP